MGRKSGVKVLVATAAVLIAGGCLLAAPFAFGDPAGKTTLSETIQFAPGTGYRALVAGPGEKYVVRTDLGPARRGRTKSRKSLLFFDQVSDVHIRDPMAPVRLDFTDAAGHPVQDGFRPQEAFSTQVWDEMVRNINLNRTSPVRGAGGKRAKLAFTFSTGDNVDSQQINEGQWYAQVAKGGTIDPFSGKLIGPGNPCNGQSAQTIARLNADVLARNYTGVQDYNDYPGAPTDRYSAYWDPNTAPPAGSPYAAFPRYPGLMNRAFVPFQAQGLQVPIFEARGNHDGEVTGNITATFSLARALSTGCLKPLPGSSFDPLTLKGLTDQQIIAKFSDPAFQSQVLGLLRPVPPDPSRAYLSAAAFRNLFSGFAKKAGYAYVDPKEAKASHGAASYFAWRPRKGLLFISLDTVSEGGTQNGNLDDPQYRWLKRVLDQNSSVVFNGRKVIHHRAKDSMIVLFGHHPLESMTSTVPDEKAGKCTTPPIAGCDADPRKSTPLHLGLKGKNNLRDLLLNYPNVIGYVNGHRHTNKIQAFKRKDRKSGFWQINTAAHADYPEGVAREIDIMDNHDGTLSLFTTMLNDAAPIAAPPPGSNAAAFTEAELASIARVLAANDPQGKGLGTGGSGSGRRIDRNTELLIKNPLVLDRHGG